ncbi:MAG TPA: hypothetical protein VJ385_20815, partial [Fibrobacteria bacterium]|nr:hypothetical protein [Fibrobacteria bacterium]
HHHTLRRGQNASNPISVVLPARVEAKKVSLGNPAVPGLLTLIQKIIMVSDDFEPVLGRYEVRQILAYEFVSDCGTSLDDLVEARFGNQTAEVPRPPEIKKQFQYLGGPFSGVLGDPFAKGLPAGAPSAPYFKYHRTLPLEIRPKDENRIAGGP